MSNFIQWKGTYICIDVRCPKCEYHSHFDGEFMYYFRCPKCKSVFQMGSSVTMTEMPKDFISNCIKEGDIDI